MNGQKYAGIYCNEKFFYIYTLSDVGDFKKDPLGEDIYLGLDSDLRSIGDAVLQALSKSRDLSISDEDRECYTNMIDEEGIEVADKWFDERYPEWKLFDNGSVAVRHKAWLDNVFSRYKIKNLNALNKNLQYVRITSDCQSTNFVSMIHDRYGGWYSTRQELALEFSITASSSVEVVGVAAKYAIGNCRGKGSDLIRGILFPKGQPETFEEYLKELGV